MLGPPGVTSQDASNHPGVFPANGRGVDGASALVLGGPTDARTPGVTNQDASNHPGVFPANGRGVDGASALELGGLGAGPYPWPSEPRCLEPARGLPSEQEMGRACQDLGGPWQRVTSRGLPSPRRGPPPSAAHLWELSRACAFATLSGAGQSNVNSAPPPSPHPPACVATPPGRSARLPNRTLRARCSHGRPNRIRRGLQRGVCTAPSHRPVAPPQRPTPAPANPLRTARAPHTRRSTAPGSAEPRPPATRPPGNSPRAHAAHGHRCTPTRTTPHLAPCA
jgi:hypothetical protein